MSSMLIKSLSRPLCRNLNYLENTINNIKFKNFHKYPKQLSLNSQLFSFLCPKSIGYSTHHHKLRFFQTSALAFDKVVVCPQFPESVADGDVKWNKKVGDQVGVDEEIAELETDKTAIPVNSPEAGVIEEIYVEDGTTVKPGDKLCKIKSG